jgi:CRISPR-associated endonuclease Cas2
MLVMLAYDLPSQRLQNLMRKEFERLGGYRVQYSIYMFKGEPHEVERVIRHMRRLATGLPGDVRMLPMEESVWEGHIVASASEKAAQSLKRLWELVEIW